MSSIGNENGGQLGYMSLAQLQEHVVHSGEYSDERNARTFGTRVFLTCLRNGAPSVKLEALGLAEEQDEFGNPELIEIDGLQEALETGTLTERKKAGWPSQIGEKSLALITSYIDGRAQFLGGQQR